MKSSTLLISLIGLLCLFFVVKFTWEGKDGNGYTGVIEGDGFGYYMYLPNTFINHSITNQKIDNRFVLPFKEKGVNKYFVGTSLAMAPFFWLGYLSAIIHEEPLDGYSGSFQRALSFSALFYLCLGLLFLWRILSHFEVSALGKSISLVTIVFGTNLLTYAVTLPTMSHVYSWCFINGFLFFWLSYTKTRSSKNLYLSLAAFGMVVLIRPVNALVFLVVPFLSLSLSEFKSLIIHTVKPKKIIVGCLVFLCIVSIQIFVWYLQTGQLLVWSYKNEGFNFLNPEFWKVLFSFRKGLFIYTPLVFISLFGLIYIWRKNRFRFFALSSFLVLLTYVLSSWWNWYYGDSFGQRPFIEYYGIAAILLAILVSEMKSKVPSAILTIVLLFCVVLNLVQSYQYHARILSGFDMTFEKYAYTFFKTSDKYSRALGGCHDIPLYNAKLTMVNDVFLDFETSKSGLNNHRTCTDSTTGNTSCDYRGKEYNMTIQTKGNKNLINNLGLYIEVELDRMKMANGLNNRVFLTIKYRDSNNETYYSTSFPIDDTPQYLMEHWKTNKLEVEAPPLKSESDRIRTSVWNPDLQPVLIDNVKMKISRMD